MVQRFQSLRRYDQLPKDRGQASPDLSLKEIVHGILSVVDPRPAYSGMSVLCLNSLLPVGGIAQSFRNANSFEEALEQIVESPSGLLELRIRGIEDNDRGIPSYAAGPRAEIIYLEDGREFRRFYVPKTAASLTADGASVPAHYPRDQRAAFEREVVMNSEVFRTINYRLNEEGKYREMMVN